jgi:predicted nucleic acid-binding protein
VLRRLEEGERVQITVDRRPVAELIPLPRRATWVLVAGARRAGRRPKVQDSWIAATAHAHRAAIYTQDADFDETPGLEVVRV